MLSLEDRDELKKLGKAAGNARTPAQRRKYMEDGAEMIAATADLFEKEMALSSFNLGAAISMADAFTESMIAHHVRRRVIALTNS